MSLIFVFRSQNLHEFEIWLARESSLQRRAACLREAFLEAKTLEDALLCLRLARFEFNLRLSDSYVKDRQQIIELLIHTLKQMNRSDLNAEAAQQLLGIALRLHLPDLAFQALDDLRQNFLQTGSQEVLALIYAKRGYLEDHKDKSLALNLLHWLPSDLSMEPQNQAVGDSLLIQAVKEGDHLRVQELLAKGVSVNQRGIKGRTALHWAIAETNTSLCELLFWWGAHFGSRDLMGQTCTDLALSGPIPEIQRLGRAAFFKSEIQP